MNQINFIIAFALAAISACNGALGSSVLGNLEIFEDFHSEFVENRTVIVVGIDNSSLRYEEYYPSEICDEVPAGVLPEDFKANR